MDFTKILNLKYIFTQNPLPMHLLQRNILIVVFGILILIAIVSAVWGRRKNIDVIAKRITSKISIFCFTLGLIGWVLFFMRQAHVYFFSRRFFFVFWFLGAAIWSFYLLKYILKKAPNEKKEIQEKREFEKYLPRKK